MPFLALKVSALAVFAVAFLGGATTAQHGDVDLVRSAEEKAHAFTQSLWCTAVFRLENRDFDEAKALDELRSHAPVFGHDTEGKIAAEIGHTMEGLAQDAWEFPDEFQDILIECIARYTND